MIVKLKFIFFALFLVSTFAIDSCTPDDNRSGSAGYRRVKLEKALILPTYNQLISKESGYVLEKRSDGKNTVFTTTLMTPGPIAIGSEVNFYTQILVDKEDDETSILFLKRIATGNVIKTLQSQVWVNVKDPLVADKIRQGDMVKMIGGQAQQNTSTTIKSNSQTVPHELIDVYFASDRKLDQNESILSFGTERGGLHYGIASISIPRISRAKVGSDWWGSITNSSQVNIISLKTVDKEKLFSSISKNINSSTKRDAIVFIPGYNTSFEEAARRTALISFNLNLQGVPVFYSWPSSNSVTGYVGDEVNIAWSTPNIETFLKEFALHSGAKSIYLIAHSMGNRALTQSYINLIKKNPELKAVFKQIILTAPDIDADIFSRDIAPALVKIGIPVTLYASSSDIPLKLSYHFHGGYQRAGDSGDNIIVVPGIESIDATGVDTGLLGHSYFSDEKSILSDLYQIINFSKPARERKGLTAVESSNGKYWRIE